MNRIIVIFLTLSFLLTSTIYLYNKNSHIDFKLIDIKKYNFNVCEQPECVIVKRVSDFDVQKYNLSIQEFNFDERIYILAKGSQLNKIVRIRSTNFPYLNSHYVKMEMDSQFQDDMIYIYSTKIKDLYFDERRGDNITCNRDG